MFSRQGGLNNAGSNTSNLVEFRAGRMNLVDKIVHPDARKGLVYMTQSDDGLMHFCWKDRITGKIEDDLIVFPDDFEFKRVNQCKTGRVYVLKFKTSSRRMFFWMQEPKSDKDEEYCRRVNELMNNPPSTARSGQDGGDLQYMLNNMSQQQLMQLFGGVGQMGGLSSLLGSMNRASDNTRTTISRNNSSNSGSLITTENSNLSRGIAVSKIKTKTEQNISQNLTIKKDGDGTVRAVSIDLSADIISSDIVNDLFADSDVVNLLSTFLPKIDNNGDKSQKIKDTIASPQFQQALSLFFSTLQSAQIGPIISQFELNPEAIAAAYTGHLEDFIKALDNTSGPTEIVSNAEEDIIDQSAEQDKSLQ